MRLLLVRHGQTAANVAGVIDAAAPGPGLTELGREQAAALVDVPLLRPSRRLYVSPLRRARETVAPLAEAIGVEPVELAGLAEIEAGELQGRADAAAVALFVDVVRRWSLGDLDAVMPGAHDGHAFFTRFDDAVGRIEREAASGEGHSCVVTHAAAMRTWVTRRAVNLDDVDEGLLRIDNTGVIVLEGTTAAGWRVESWNGHPIGGAALEDPFAKDPTGEPE